MMNNILEPIGIKFGKFTEKSKIEDEVRFESSHIAGISLEGMEIETKFWLIKLHNKKGINR